MMNTMDDPVPFNSTEECGLADVSHSGNLLQPSIAIHFRFHPILPIPSISSIQVILDKEQLHTWRDKIPEGICPLPHTRITIQNNTYSVPYDTIQSFLLNHIPNFSIPDPVMIDISYSLSIQNKLDNCLSVAKSIGELSSLTDSILQTDRTTLPPPPRRNNSINYIHEGLSLIFTNIDGNSTTDIPTFNEELNTLTNMGFNNREINYRSLLLTSGNVEAAINIILASDLNGS
jgi:hypothetical protein